MVIPWLAAYGGGEQEKEMGLVGPHWAWLVGISGNFDLIRMTRTCFVFELVIGQDNGDPPGSCRARTHPIQPLRSTLPGRDPQQRPPLSLCNWFAVSAPSTRPVDTPLHPPHHQICCRPRRGREQLHRDGGGGDGGDRDRRGGARLDHHRDGMQALPRDRPTRHGPRARPQPRPGLPHQRRRRLRQRAAPRRPLRLHRATRKGHLNLITSQSEPEADHPFPLAL